MSPINPCGMTMDYLRFAYTAKMQFTAGGPEVPVVWYRVGPKTPAFPGYHRFASLMWWERERGGNPVGEVGGDYTWYRGDPPFPALGDKPCGQLSWFANGAPADAPALPLAPDGFPTCCKRRAAGVVAGGEAIMVEDELIMSDEGGGEVGGTAFWCGWHIPKEASPLSFLVENIVGYPAVHGKTGLATYNPVSDSWGGTFTGPAGTNWAFTVVCGGTFRAMTVQRGVAAPVLSLNETVQEPFFTSIWVITGNFGAGVGSLRITLTK